MTKWDSKHKTGISAQANYVYFEYKKTLWDSRCQDTKLVALKAKEAKKHIK